MEPKSPFLSAVNSAFEDDRRRWWMYYFAVLMVGMVVHSIHVAAVGFHPEDYVASHPGAFALDRCLFAMTLVLTIVGVALWVVCIWKTMRAESLGERLLVLFLITSGSPFEAAKNRLGRIPGVAELASTLQEILFLPVPFVALWFLVYGFKRAQEENQKEVEAYKARRASKSHEPEGVSPGSRQPVEAVPGGM